MNRSALRSLTLAPARSKDSHYSRAESPVVAVLPRPGLPSTAHHDFLVPNPRPDLTLGLQTLRMIQVS